MKIVGTLVGSKEHTEIVRSPTVKISTVFRLNLDRNDKPVTLFYKCGNTAWKPILVNDKFMEDAIPRYSDVYLMAHLSREEVVDFTIEH